MELPKKILTMIQRSYPDQEEKILTGMQGKKTPSFRINTQADKEKVLEEIQELGIFLEKHPVYIHAYITNSEGEKLLKEKNFPREGKIYFQGISSMLPAVLFPKKAPEKILDICSAPGGKTTLLANVFPESPIVAIEKSAIRYRKLKNTLRIQKTGNVRHIRGDILSPTKEIKRQKYNIILIDPPCSGSGTLISENPKSFAHLEEDYDGYVKLKQKQQTAILSQSLELLADDGEIIYCTCSIDPRENSQIIKTVLEKNPEYTADVDIQIPDVFEKLKNSDDPYGITLCPTGQYEGFYVCKIRKKS